VQQTGPAVEQRPLGQPYLPGIHASDLAQFRTMLAEDNPTRAKRIDTDGGMVVTCGRRRVYFRASSQACVVLKGYGIVLDDPAEEGAPFVPRPPKPAVHAKNLAEFCTHLHNHRPFAAKIIDSGTGAMLVYCDDVNVYFRNAPHALRALRHYKVAP
jgi:hypothetical protein